MKRDAVLFYRSFAESIKEYPKDQQLKAIWAIIDYGLDGKEFKGRGLARSAYLMAKPQIDANNKRYENAKKGGAPLGNQNARKQTKDNRDTTEIQPKNNQKTTKKLANDKDKVNVNVNDKNLLLLTGQIGNKDLEQAVRNFIDHRKKIKAPMTDQGYKLMMSRLEKLSGGREDIKIEILNQSIMNGWKGVFPIDRQKTRTAGFNNSTPRDYDMRDLEIKLLATN